MICGELLAIEITGRALLVNLNLVAAALLLAIFIVWRVWRHWNRADLLVDTVEIELDVPSVGKIKIKPNYENIQIAHEAWVELSTRKASVPFVRDQDVIVEVYDSYYALFGELRALTKRVPAQHLRKSEDTKALVDLLVKVLNVGLRPHLTRWQAEFRRWYSEQLELDTNIGLSPQEIQRKFPSYIDLVDQLEVVQGELVQLAGFLQTLSHGELVHSDKNLRR